MKAETSLLPLKLTQNNNNNNNNNNNYMMNVYSGTCSQNVLCIILQVFNTSQKLHATECNSSERGEIRFEGPRPISLSVAQNNCWLVPESNLEQKIQSSTHKYRSPSNLQNEIKKKKIAVLKSKKSFLFEKIDKNIQFNYLFLVNF